VKVEWAASGREREEAGDKALEVGRGWVCVQRPDEEEGTLKE
jgi:hypothetical protein